MGDNVKIKKHLPKIICGLMIIIIPLLSFGCMGTAPTAPAAAPVQTQASINAALQKADADLTTSLNQVKTQLDAKNAEQDKKIAESGGAADSYTKSEIDSKFNNIISNLTADQITTLKTKLGVTSTGSITDPFVTSTGTISYAVTNTQPYYQFSTSSNYPLQIRVMNNKSDARYIRLQMTATTFGNSAAGAFSSPAADIATNSNSLGQTPSFYLINAVGNSVLLIASTGGVSGSGEYLLSSGQTMDLYITLTIHCANAVLWNLSVSGSDRPIS